MFFSKCCKIQHQVEETPPSDYESSGEEEETPATSRSTKRFSSEPSEGSHKSDEIRMTPSVRYPALINSTVVAGGAPFPKEPLSMSPILVEKDRPSRVQATPSTPAPFNRKRAVSQSPMFMSVMQKTISKAAPEHKLATPSASSAPSPTKRKSESGRILVAPKRTSISKGSSSFNPKKGKSLGLPDLDEITESSDTEWEDLEDVPKEMPLPIRIAFEVNRVGIFTVCLSDIFFRFCV